LHILFSTAVFGIVYLPLSISSLCALIRKHARVDRLHNNGQHCWVSCIYYILKELDMLKMFKSPLTCGAREINIIRKKLKEQQC
jgi:hypothetical protein